MDTSYFLLSYVHVQQMPEFEFESYFAFYLQKLAESKDIVIWKKKKKKTLLAILGLSC